MTVIQSKPSAKMSIALSMGVVLVCLALGAAFVWWYVAGQGNSKTVRLSVNDLATMQTAGRQLNYQSNGGVPLGGGTQLIRLGGARQSDPDGVFPTGIWQVIKSGPVLARVQGKTIVFRQRNWGALIDGPDFTIARRIIHEPALAKQLAVTPEELTPLAAIVATPALKGGYITALPVRPPDMDSVNKAWIAFTTAQTGKDADALNRARAELLATVKAIGSRAMLQAHEEYQQAEKNIDSILEPRQIQAYRAGKSLDPLK